MSKKEKYVLVFRYRYRDRIFSNVTEHFTYNEAIEEIERSKKKIAEGAKFYTARIAKHTSEVVYEQ